MEKIVSLVYANIWYVAILALPCLSYMLFDWFQKGMILSIYGKWLFKERSEDAKILWLVKPLGGCLKCMHVWIVIIFSVIFIRDINLIKFIIALSISYHILVKSYFG